VANPLLLLLGRRRGDPRRRDVSVPTDIPSTDAIYSQVIGWA